MSRIRCDLCVIGAGSGGLSIAAGAVQMGASVVLIEGGEMGGDCLNHGCVPSKAMLAAGKHAFWMGTGAPFGVARQPAAVDWAGTRRHIREVIDGIAPHDSQERFEGLGVTVIRAWARFVSNCEVMADGRTVEARRFVIATGSAPAIPPIPGIENVPVLTNETVFDLQNPPERLLVLGGGPIGVEMAQAHARLGVPVTLFEAGRALGREDPDAAAIVLQRLRAEGVEIHENAPATAVRAEHGVTVEAGGHRSGSHLLVATGRRPTLDGLDLEAGQIARGDEGVTVDAGLRSTTNPRVYAVGDAAGQGQFTHLAGYHAGIVIRRALFSMPAKARTDHIPRVTYTDPELAQVGPTEAEAPDAEVYRADLAENDRARAERATDGFAKILVRKGRVVGATVVGRMAGELIAPAVLAVSAKLKVSALASMVAPYPTFSEVTKRAAGQYYVPRLFQSDRVKRIVGWVQRTL